MDLISINIFLFGTINYQRHHLDRSICLVPETTVAFCLSSALNNELASRHRQECPLAVRTRGRSPGEWFSGRPPGALSVTAYRSRPWPWQDGAARPAEEPPDWQDRDGGHCHLGPGQGADGALQCQSGRYRVDTDTQTWPVQTMTHRSGRYRH